MTTYSMTGNGVITSRQLKFRLRLREQLPHRLRWALSVTRLWLTPMRAQNSSTMGPILSGPRAGTTSQAQAADLSPRGDRHHQILTVDTDQFP